VFSADELAQLRGFPEIGHAELIRFFMLTPADEEFVRRFRDKRNVLGVAVQLCALPWLGFVPEDVPAAPAAAVTRLSERLGIPVGELSGYGAREQTRSDHLRGRRQAVLIETAAERAGLRDQGVWRAATYGLRRSLPR
jgi:hypothetical protein